MPFIRNSLFTFFSVSVLFLFSFSFLKAESVVYLNPLWGDIDQENPPNSVTHPASTEIGFDGTSQVLTAFHFCDSLGFSYVSYLADGNVSPSIIWVAGEWTNANNKSDFLTITCDDGVVATSTAPVVNVALDVPDYTIFFQYFMLIFSSMMFMGFVIYWSSLVKKFL